MANLRESVRKAIRMGTGIEMVGLSRDTYLLRRGGAAVHHLYPAGTLILNQGEEEPAARGVQRYLRTWSLKNALDRLGIDLVLDVGANRGQFGEELRRMGYAGRIVSFEPIASAFSDLSAVAARDGNWECHEMALGRHNEERLLRVSDDSVFTSFLEPNRWCGERFGSRATDGRSERVVVRRLADLMADSAFRLDGRRVFLKMDTQGFDLEVFGGLPDGCNAVVLLQSEVSVVPIYEGMPHFTESIAAFERAGYEVIGLFPVSTDLSTLRVIEYDCLMVRAGAA